MLVERKPLRHADEIKLFFSRRRDRGAAVLGQNRSYSYQMKLKLDTVLKGCVTPGPQLRNTSYRSSIINVA